MKNSIFALILLFFANTLLAQKSEYLKEEVVNCHYRTNSIDVNKDNTKLLIGGENKMVMVYDLVKKKNVFEMEAHYQPVVEVQFSNKHDGFYTVGDKSFKLWINGEEKAEKLFTGSHTSITDWAMTPAEDYFVGGSHEKKFRYWNASTLTTPQSITTSQTKSVISVAISDNHKLIACGSLDKTIELYKTDSLTQTRRIIAHAGPISCLEFVNHDKNLISASHDGYAKLWNVNTGKNIKVYSGHTKPVSAIDISPNGKYLLTASYDNSINLYMISTGDLIYHYVHHETPVLDVKWNNKGDEFYSCDKEGQIARWSVPKSLFVDFYFGADMNNDIHNNELFQPKSKGESRDAYKERQVKAEAYEQKLFDTYYQKYLELLKTQTIAE
ncbi:WD40 repeat domain-containing protein [Marinilabiliaceae bacterium JC017]|nr:WD40 repeat domain-containing protein [Marinilabiliaceae bacterium JC017]